MSEIEVFAKSIVKAAANKLSPISFLSGQVRSMEREDVDALAIAYLYAQVKNRQRAGVLTVERSASKPRVPKRGTAAYEAFVEQPDQAWRKEADAAEDKLRANFETEVEGYIQIFASSLKVQWTDELLASRFALGDGSEVSWGDATREQHEYRYRMHAQNAVAGMEGAARHRQAIEELDKSGATTLREAVGVKA